MELHEAITKGFIEAVKQHLAAGADVDVNVRDSIGSPPLHYAARNVHESPPGSSTSSVTYTHNRHKEIAELLIAKGADVNVRDYHGKTPLQYAAFSGLKETAELLIANGADVNAKGYDEWTPLHLAAIKGRKDTAELLIAKGANVNASGEGPWTPLHSTAFGGHKQTAELLIAKGADVNAMTENSETPLDVAIRLKQTEIALLLLRKHGGKMGEALNAEGK